MTPVLLDQNSILRVGAVLGMIMIVAFVGGYYTGYQEAVSGEGVDLNKTMVLALPKPAHADASEFEPFIPEVQKPGADIDVDSPGDTHARADYQDLVGEHGASTAAGVTSLIEQATNAIETPATAADAEATVGQPLQLASASDAEREAAGAIIDSEQGGVQHQAADRRDAPSETTDAASQAMISDSANAVDARYTIQVGVFADADNAMRRKSELSALQLTAYVNEYRNKRDQPRFNVRFGYFKDKSSASAALTVFEQSHSGSGYVTRIRGN